MVGRGGLSKLRDCAYCFSRHSGAWLDKLTYAGRRENIAGLPSDRVELVVGDICDAGLLDELVPGCDAVVHCAAETHNDSSTADSEPFLRTNVFCQVELTPFVK